MITQSLIQYFFWIFGFLKAIIYFFKFLNFQKTDAQPIQNEEDTEPADAGTYLLRNFYLREL
mgnify:CR=1 FL=1